MNGDLARRVVRECDHVQGPVACQDCIERASLPPGGYATIAGRIILDPTMRPDTFRGPYQTLRMWVRP